MTGVNIFHFFFLYFYFKLYDYFFICNYTHFDHVQSLIIYEGFWSWYWCLDVILFHSILFSTCITIFCTFAWYGAIQVAYFVKNMIYLLAKFITILVFIVRFAVAIWSFYMKDSYLFGFQFCRMNIYFRDSI